MIKHQTDTHHQTANSQFQSIGSPILAAPVLSDKTGRDCYPQSRAGQMKSRRHRRIAQSIAHHKWLTAAIARQRKDKTYVPPDSRLNIARMLQRAMKASPSNRKVAVFLIWHVAAFVLCGLGQQLIKSKYYRAQRQSFQNKGLLRFRLRYGLYCLYTSLSSWAVVYCGKSESKAYPSTTTGVNGKT